MSSNSLRKRCCRRCTRRMQRIIKKLILAPPLNDLLTLCLTFTLGLQILLRHSKHIAGQVMSGTSFVTHRGSYSDFEGSDAGEAVSNFLRSSFEKVRTSRVQAPQPREALEAAEEQSQDEAPSDISLVESCPVHRHKLQDL